jgi:hypothetical protein
LLFADTSFLKLKPRGKLIELLRKMNEAIHMAASQPGPLLAASAMQGDETLFWLLVALLATVVMFGSFCSYLLVRHLARRCRSERDDALFILHPFKISGNFTFPGDYPCRWLAIKSHNPGAVLEALQLTKASPCSWEEGLARTFDRKLFVSPPIHGWIIVLGTALPDPALDIDVCFRFLLHLSRKLGQVQFFNMNRALSHHAWAILDKGTVLRAYAWAGQTLWNQGSPTAAEEHLAIRFLEYGEVLARKVTARFDPMAANTEKVPLLAARWGIDPAALGRSLMDERRGLTGELPLSHQV